MTGGRSHAVETPLGWPSRHAGPRSRWHHLRRSPWTLPPALCSCRQHIATTADLLLLICRLAGLCSSPERLDTQQQLQRPAPPRPARSCCGTAGAALPLAAGVFLYSKGNIVLKESQRSGLAASVHVSFATRGNTSCRCSLTRVSGPVPVFQHAASCTTSSLIGHVVAA